MIKEIEVTSVLNKTKKRDPWFLDDYTFNPYSSCSFNCLYCYIRGSKYGTNLEKKLSVKTNAIELLDKQLANRARKGQYGIIVLSSVTDPYLQIEKEYKLTQQALEVILKHKFPVHIITKSDMISRDFELLKEIEQNAILPSDLSQLKKGVIISFSFSTIQNNIGKIFEPGAPLPTKRIEALRHTINQGFLTGVSFMPLIPHITDTSEQLHQSFKLFKDIGVDYIFPATITLFGNGKADSKTLIFNAIEKYYPELLEKYKKFFATSTQMPAYYQNAFRKKMNELCQEYGLHNDIIKAAVSKYTS
ncbi:radical SAM protein [Aquimarina sp. 2201CG1-2-11]|uniref:SPL family radical SAM protein n=1 Tax=Aquimarina discodermiae TaxID=3231043 RepID=UPI003462D2A4